MESTGRIRYIGITHYTASAFADLEAIMRAEPLDFVQFNYSAVDRAVSPACCPLRRSAASRRSPIIRWRAARPCARSRRPLPDWAAEIDRTSWAQFLLKFVVSHPAITCAIPEPAIRAHGRQCPCRYRTDARPGHARPDRRFLRRITRHAAENWVASVRKRLRAGARRTVNRRSQNSGNENFSWRCRVARARRGRGAPGGGRPVPAL